MENETVYIIGVWFFLIMSLLLSGLCLLAVRLGKKQADRIDALSLELADARLKRLSEQIDRKLNK